VTTDQGGQKNRNGKTIVILFTMFSTSVWEAKRLVVLEVHQDGVKEG
jgi:hypothetical protein